MGKCSSCLRHGLFLKVDKQTGLCKACEYDRAEAEAKKRLEDTNALIAETKKQLEDTNALLAEAIESAKTEAFRNIESETSRLEKERDGLVDAIRDLTAKRDSIHIELQGDQAKLDSIQSKLIKLKPLATSINVALAKTAHGEDVQPIENLEEILPEQELNCLTVKTLAAKYRDIRKQIVTVCKSYEENYLTKTIRAVYRLMVMGLEAEFENVLYKLKFGTLDAAISSIRDLTSKYYAIAIEGNQTIAPTLKRFIVQIESLYLRAVDVEYEYYVQRERAKEEQRAIKEQMRQEAEERKRLEQEKKKVDAEEEKYQIEIKRICAKMQEAKESEIEALRARLAEVEQMVAKVEERKAEIINLQNGKAGTVYIISNIGSFGDHVFKIGMTRRLEPQDRVDELGSASVPFPFDVHSFIFSDDAVSLETLLHKELNDHRVNKINLRKEFFDVTIDELKELVARIDPTAPFKETALAEQYRQSQSMKVVPMAMVDVLDEE